LGELAADNYTFKITNAVVSSSVWLFCIQGGLAKFRAHSRRPLMHKFPPLSPHSGCSYLFGISGKCCQIAGVLQECSSPWERWQAGC